MEDTVLVERVCDDNSHDNVNNVPNGDEISVEVLHHDSSGEKGRESNISGEREDIIQALQAVQRVKDAIQYHDDESLQQALDKVKERPLIDEGFGQKLEVLLSIRDNENYTAFYDVVEKAIGLLIGVQEKSRRGKTTLSRPIEVLNEVLPVFEEACSVYTEKIVPSSSVKKTLQKVDEYRVQLNACTSLEDADLQQAKKLEKRCEQLLEEAVKNSLEDVNRIEERIQREKEAATLERFGNTRKEANARMDVLTEDFEQMKQNCGDDIQLTERTLQVEIESKDNALEKFQVRDKELGDEILMKMVQEEELQRQLQQVQEHRMSLENERDFRREKQKQADEVHKQAEEDLQLLMANIENLLSKVDTANVVLKQTKDVCNILFEKAVESKTMQEQDLENALLQSKKNRHLALIAQGVNCLNVKMREEGTIRLLKDKIKKKKAKYQESLKYRLEDEAKKLQARLTAMNGELESSKKIFSRVDEKLKLLREQIDGLQKDLDEAEMNYVTLDQAYEDFKKHEDGDDGYSLTSLP